MEDLIYDSNFYKVDSIKQINNLTEYLRNITLYQWLLETETTNYLGEVRPGNSIPTRILESHFHSQGLKGVFSSKEIRNTILKYQESEKNSLSTFKNSIIIKALEDLLSRLYLINRSYDFYLELLKVDLNINKTKIKSTKDFLKKQKSLIEKIAIISKQLNDKESNEFNKNIISHSVRDLGKFCVTNETLFRNKNIKSNFISIFITPNNMIYSAYDLTDTMLNLLKIEDDDLDNDNLLAWNIREDIRIISESLDEQGYHDVPQNVIYYGLKNEHFYFIKNKNINKKYKEEIFNYLELVRFI